jgi:transcriptional regulator with XRE-family HTH domain
LFSPTRPDVALGKGRVYLLCPGRQDAALRLVSGLRLDAARLEYELVRRGWDAIDLARAAGVSPGTLSAAMRGRRINQRTVIRLAVALGD